MISKVRYILFIIIRYDSMAVSGDFGLFGVKLIEKESGEEIGDI